MRKSNVHGFAIRRQRGAIGIMVAVLLPVLIGFLGLALELGRLYNRKAEMQAVADVVAMSAAKKLNGTSDGIDAALAAAHDVVESGDGSTTMPYYGYWQTMAFSDGAIAFAKSPDGAWMDADAAKAAPAGIAYVKVDTNRLNVDYGTVALMFMQFLSKRESMTVAHIAIAGRHALKVMPFALCAMHKDPANPFKERVNAAGYSELTEYGFRRGISYNLMRLSPISSTPVSYVIDPVSLPPKTGDFSANIIGAYVCTGTVELPGVIGRTLNLQSGFQVDKYFNQLNSRLNLSNNQCSPASAPPDANVKQFTFGTNTWMTNPNRQVAQGATSTSRLESIADLDPPNDQTPALYGPLWVFSRPVPWSAYTAGQAEPAKGYATFDATAPNWKALYSTGPGLKTYPTDPKTGLQSPPYFAQVSGPSTNYPGVAYRRVLNVPLLDCSGGAPGKVLALGRFFMTVPADANGIYAEFAGVTFQEELAGSVELMQ
jgi:Flp pilus assembly protein TadG